VYKLVEGLERGDKHYTLKHNGIAEEVETEE